MKITNTPHLNHELELWKKDYLVIGVDEVGRGAFAGPLVLGGVIFKPAASIKEIDELLSIGINDSKKLTAEKRQELNEIIKKIALSYSFASISVNIINKHGISKATSIGVRKVVSGLINIQNTKYKILDSKYYLLMDAFYIKYVKGVGLKNQKAIIHGDAISLSISAASIIAKVKRDEMMVKLSNQYPDYKWHENKGYGTNYHREALKQYGKTIYHRDLWINNLIS